MGAFHFTHSVHTFMYVNYVYVHMHIYSYVCIYDYVNHVSLDYSLKYYCTCIYFFKKS
jgi:hypothetical protein